MKLSVWAKKKGVTYRTAWNHFKSGKIPNAHKLGTGTIIVDGIGGKPDHVVTYARVNRFSQRPALKAQSQRLQNYCKDRGWKVHRVTEEIGSGIDDTRKKLGSILRSGRVTKLVVENEDRLSRYGVEYIQIICKIIDCELIFTGGSKKSKSDLIDDGVRVIKKLLKVVLKGRHNIGATRLMGDLNEERKKN